MTTKKTDKTDKTPTPTVTQPGSPSEVRAPGRASVSTPVERSSNAEVDAFLQHMRALAPQAGAGQGRLVFAMDATMSRQPTWDLALALQSEMFEAVRDVGGLDVQLVYFRGFGECRASKWVRDPLLLRELMTKITCQGGVTQIGKVLAHARTETASKRVNALVFVGDMMEESIDELVHKAGELGLLGLPAFMFQEGHNHLAETAFREIARVTKGAWCRFDAGSASQLRELLRAVAVYAAGGRSALRQLANTQNAGAARRLLQQLPP